MTNPNQPAPQRTEAQFRESARHYIEEQLETMAKYGHQRVLSLDEYYRIEDEIVAAGKELWQTSGGEIV